MTERQIFLPSSLIARRLFQACAVMVLLGIACHVVRWYAPPEYGKLRHLAALFDLNEERTVPTAFAVGQLLLAAGVVGLVAWQRRMAGDGFWRHWAGLALLVMLLALDEQAGLHERMTEPTRRMLGTGEPLGIFYYAWVLPGAALVLGVGLLFARFLLHLPADTRRGLVLSGAVFVGGALGMELLGGRFFEAEGHRSLGLLIASTLEEGMELFGIALLVRAVTQHTARHIGPISLHVAASPLAKVEPLEQPSRLRPATTGRTATATQRRA